MVIETIETESITEYPVPTILFVTKRYMADHGNRAPKVSFVRAAFIITIAAEVITGITIPLVQMVINIIGDSINISRNVPKLHSKRLIKIIFKVSSLALAKIPTIKQKNQDNKERLMHHIISVKNLHIKRADFDMGMVRIVFRVFSVYSRPNI